MRRAGNVPGTEVCTHTDASGNYTILGLATDSYRIGFQPPEGVDFVEQFYSGKEKGYEADRVDVTVGAVTPNIDVALQEAGQIAGTVTDATTHAPLAGVGIEALETFPTDPSGSPSPAPMRAVTTRCPLLMPGQYTVRFSPESQMPGNYADQWYSCNKETSVTVSAGQVTSGIDGALYKVGVEQCPVVARLNRRSSSARPRCPRAAPCAARPDTPNLTDASGASGTSGSRASCAA